MSSNRDRSAGSSTSHGLGRAVEERGLLRERDSLGREASAYRLDDTSAGGGGGSTVSSPPGAGGGDSGAASLAGLQHEFAADASTAYGIEAADLVDGALTAFRLEDADGNDVQPLDGIVHLYENGVHLSALLGDYSVSGRTITFATAPRDRISGWCLKAPVSTHPS